MNRLRNRLILIFLAATLVPLLATLWITSAGSKYLLDFSTTGELDSLSQSLEDTGHQFYQRAMGDLKQRVARGEAQPAEYPAAQRRQWPEAVRNFAGTVESERWVLGGVQGDGHSIIYDAKTKTAYGANDTRSPDSKVGKP